MKIVIAGFADTDSIRQAVLDSGFTPTEVIGPVEDLALKRYTEEERLPITPHHANFTELGDYAWPMRNMDMIMAGEALVAHASELHLIACARKKAMPLYVVVADPNPKPALESVPKTSPEALPLPVAGKSPSAYTFDTPKAPKARRIKKKRNTRVKTLYGPRSPDPQGESDEILGFVP